MVGLPDGEKTLMICVIITQYRRVTDGRTDRHLTRHSVRYAYASRGKKPTGVKHNIAYTLL